MDATTIVTLELDRLTLDFYCTACNGVMVPTRTIAGERSLTCCRCGHEVAWATRFASCLVSEWTPVLPEFVTAPLGGGKVTKMTTIDVWWSPVAQCWRIEDGEMFTYYNLDLVIAHFRNRDRPARALLVPPPHDMHTAMLDLALRNAGVAIVYSEVTP